MEPAASLSRELHEVRIRHRRQRLERVIAALRDREAEIQRRGGPVPPPLREAIRGFGSELDLLARAWADQVGDGR